MLGENHLESFSNAEGRNSLRSLESELTIAIPDQNINYCDLRDSGER